MSAEAAKIISKISGRKNSTNTKIILGTVKAISPLTVKFDGIDFDINSLLINSFLLEHNRTANATSSTMDLLDLKIQFDRELSVGDRVAGMEVGGSSYVILCKVVKA